MREIILDTETTGINPDDGHRLVEIGCVELVNRVASGKEFHCYINPERDMPTGAFDVHGLSEAFLADKPVFAAVAPDFLAFIGDAPLVIHNASFDMKFINAELRLLGLAALPMSRAIDTVMMAREKFPGQPASLDALCRRFGIDNSRRDKHGALLDAQLLAEVYVELMGGRQTGLSLGAAAGGDKPAGAARHGQALLAGGMKKQLADRPVRPPRNFAVSPEEAANHAAFLQKIKNPLWQQPDE